MDILFHRTRRLERQIDEYLDLVVQGGLIFRSALDHYMEDRHGDFSDRLHDLQKLESKADELRREIETRLYTETLLPESRGDILGLLETIDKVINRCEENLQDFSVEKPEILPELLTDFRELIASTVDCVDEMVMAARSYFRDPKAVRDHIARARFHEQASDRVGGRSGASSSRRTSIWRPNCINVISRCGSIESLTEPRMSAIAWRSPTSNAPSKQWAPRLDGDLIASE